MSAEQAREENADSVGLQAFLWNFSLQFYSNVIPSSEKTDVGRLKDFHKYTTLKIAKDRHIVTPRNVTVDAYGDFGVTRQEVLPQLVQREICPLKQAGHKRFF
jgi:hypothetical protein